MKRAGKFSLVLVTAPDLKIARQIVAVALEQGVAACGNLLPGLESHYWWRGKIEQSAEVQILFKTSASKLKKLEKLILATHPYETPEIIALPLHKGNAKYLNWIKDSLRPGK